MWQSGSNEDLGRKDTSTDKNKDSPIGGPNADRYMPTANSKPIDPPATATTSKPAANYRNPFDKKKPLAMVSKPSPKEEKPDYKFPASSFPAVEKPTSEKVKESSDDIPEEYSNDGFKDEYEDNDFFWKSNI